MMANLLTLKSNFTPFLSTSLNIDSSRVILFVRSYNPCFEIQFKSACLGLVEICSAAASNYPKLPKFLFKISPRELELTLAAHNKLPVLEFLYQKTKQVYFSTVICRIFFYGTCLYYNGMRENYRGIWGPCNETLRICN